MSEEHFNIKGERITREEANRLLGRPQDLLVAEDTVPPGITLTTVCTVVAHHPPSGPCPCGRPYLFQTVLTDDKQTHPIMRWHTYDEALEGHRDILDGIRVIPVEDGARVADFANLH